MKVTVSTALNRVFIPEWNSNKEQPEVEQIKIAYKAPTIAMKDSLFERKFDFVQSADKKDDKGNPVMEPAMSITVDRQKVISAFVTKIENLVADIDGVDVPIKTAAQLFSAGVEFDGLVEELYTYLNNLINQRVIDEKN
jgi:hypothetical protein